MYWSKRPDVNPPLGLNNWVHEYIKTSEILKPHLYFCWQPSLCLQFPSLRPHPEYPGPGLPLPSIARNLLFSGSRKEVKSWISGIGCTFKKCIILANIEVRSNTWEKYFVYEIRYNNGEKFLLSNVYYFHIFCVYNYLLYMYL